MRRFVVTLHPSTSGEYLSLLSVEELAKKKGVKTVQTTIAWNPKRVTALIPRCAN